MCVSSSTSSRILSVKRGTLEQVVQLIGQFRRQRREIIDEIERVLDLVRDTRSELAKRSELFRLHQAILRGAEVIQGLREVSRALLQFLEQLDIRNGDHGLIGESLAATGYGGRRTCRAATRVTLIAPMVCWSRNSGTNSTLR